jgi:hypothetical protein
MENRDDKSQDINDHQINLNIININLKNENTNNNYEKAPVDETGESIFGVNDNDQNKDIK